MKELMNNPYAWALLSLCTIISFLFAIYTWIVGRKGGKPIRDCSKLRKNNGIKGLLITCIDELIPMLIFGIGFYTPVIMLEIIGISYK